MTKFRHLEPAFSSHIASRYFFRQRYAASAQLHCALRKPLACASRYPRSSGYRGVRGACWARTLGVLLWIDDDDDYDDDDDSFFVLVVALVSIDCAVNSLIFRTLPMRVSFRVTCLATALSKPFTTSSNYQVSLAALRCARPLRNTLSWPQHFD